MMNRKRFVIGSMSMYCHCSIFTEVQKVVPLALAFAISESQAQRCVKNACTSAREGRTGQDKGLEESKQQNFAPQTDIPNACFR